MYGQPVDPQPHQDGSTSTLSPDNDVPAYKGALAAPSPRGNCCGVGLGLCCLLFVGVVAVAYAVFHDRVNRELVTLRLFDDGVDYGTLAYEVRDTTVHFTFKRQHHDADEDEDELILPINAQDNVVKLSEFEQKVLDLEIEKQLAYKMDEIELGIYAGSIDDYLAVFPEAEFIFAFVITNVSALENEDWIDFKDWYKTFSDGEWAEGFVAKYDFQTKRFEVTE